jgi:hypothetical protein
VNRFANGCEENVAPPGSVSGRCCARPRFPWSPPLAPPCSARTETGHTIDAPPRSVMTSRRRSGRDASLIPRPPHRTVRAACPHTAPTSGGWRQSDAALRTRASVWDNATRRGEARSGAGAVPHMLPSSECKPSAPAMSDLTRLNPTPHAIAVYASQPPSPVTTQHSLPSGRCPLLGPVFHRLDRTSLPGALIRSPRRRGRGAKGEW